MSLRPAVAAEARAWLATPYHHLANVRGAGVDCAMLLVEVYRAVGLVPVDLDPRPYAPQWHLHRGEEKFLAWLQQYGRQVPRPRMGDVVVWRFGRAYSHGAVVVADDGTIVHAYQEAGCVVLGRLSETALAQRESLAFEVLGVDA